MPNFCYGWQLTKENAVRFAHENDILPHDENGKEPHNEGGKWYFKVCHTISKRAGAATCSIRTCWAESGRFVLVYAFFEQETAHLSRVCIHKRDLPPIDKLIELHAMVGGDLTPEWFVDSESVAWWPGPGYLTQEARDDVEAGLRAEEEEPDWYSCYIPVGSRSSAAKMADEGVQNPTKPSPGEETVAKMEDVRI